MKSTLKDPLIHFLLLGAALFLLFRFTAEEGGERTINVDQEALLTFLQYRSIAFDREYFESYLEGLEQDKLEELIAQYVREETMYREALNLGLDEDDYNIRERLVQKLQFLAEGFQSTNAELTTEEIEHHYQQNISLYYINPRITFTHVYFSSSVRGQDETIQLAQNKLEELNTNKVSFDEAADHGDPFPYFVNYVEHTPSLVASHLGENLMETLFNMMPDEHMWRGPLESPYGFHLVMVLRVQQGRQPELDEILERVKEDGRTERLRELTEAAIIEMTTNYKIEIDPSLKISTSSSSTETP
ncbi:MAG: peptidylprolyl isomerase [Pseudomonadota bacterium]|nr:peptidylprolyl isomerase [Pseudomonadota bacterium]